MRPARITLFAIAALLALSCHDFTAERATVIHQRVAIDPSAGERLTIFYNTYPYPYEDYLVEIAAPWGDVVYLQAGAAVQRAYGEAMGALYTLTNRAKYYDYTIDSMLDELDVKADVAFDGGRAKGRLVYKHNLRVIMPLGKRLADIELRAERPVDFEYLDNAGYARRMSDEFGALLMDVERQLHDKLKSSTDVIKR